MADGIYNAWKGAIGDGTIDWTTADLRVKLVTSSTFDPDDATIGAVTFQEPTDESYSEQSLANATVTVDNDGDLAVYDVDDVEFGELGGDETVVGYIVYDGATDVPVCHVDSVGDRTLQGDPFTLEFPDGVVAIQ